VTLLIRLGNGLGDMHFKDVSAEYLIDFFNDPYINKSWKTRDNYGTSLILFFRWLLKCRRKERPENMEWFDYTVNAKRRQSKDPDAYKKYFIEPEGYEKIIEHCVDYMDMALFEVLYVSGARPDEVSSMKIHDVEILDNGEVWFTLRKSKTDPRRIPIGHSINNLLRWLDFHPGKNNPEAPLWLTYARRKLKLPIEQRDMKAYTIGDKLKDIIDRAGLKTTITPHCFRKTRATIMFAEGISDYDMGYYFGWSAGTVIKRREEYDLKKNEKFQQKIFANAPALKKYDTIERENKSLVKAQADRIKELESQMQLILDKIGVDFTKPGPHGTFADEQP
jgi:integrase